MKLVRRVVLALALAGLGAAIVRVRGRGGVPPQRGGWQELPVTDDS